MAQSKKAEARLASPTAAARSRTYRARSPDLPDLSRWRAHLVFRGANAFERAQYVGVMRFSIDFRTVHRDDAVEKKGVPNIDADRPPESSRFGAHAELILSPLKWSDSSIALAGGAPGMGRKRLTPVLYVPASGAHPHG